MLKPQKCGMQVCGVHNTNNDIFVSTSAYYWMGKAGATITLTIVEEGNKLTRTLPTPSIDSNHRLDASISEDISCKSILHELYRDIQSAK